MARTLGFAVLLFGLAGCANLADWSLFAPGGSASGSADSRNEFGHYSFDWRLSGDQAVAPVQVFDNGRQVWLQFAPGQPLPAIFERTRNGDRPLSFSREGPYVVLQGVRPNLVLRGGHLQSFADRVVDQLDTQWAPAPPLVDAVKPDAAPLVRFVDVSEVDSVPPAIGANTAAGPESSGQPIALNVAAVAPPDNPQTQPETSEATEVYTVGPTDKNLRIALSRWAQRAGWVFESEHWAVDADIPIVGSARFESKFKGAVRKLVASTELADRPLQPCFYSNKVLRIVPYAQLCDRTVSVAGAS